MFNIYLAAEYLPSARPPPRSPRAAPAPRGVTTAVPRVAVPKGVTSEPRKGAGSEAAFEVRAAIATKAESANLLTANAISPLELNSLTSEDAVRSSAFIRATRSNFANLIQTAS